VQHKKTNQKEKEKAAGEKPEAMMKEKEEQMTVLGFHSLRY
jgi:hypothetical protein